MNKVDLEKRQIIEDEFLIGVEETEYFVPLINILYRIAHRIAELKEKGLSEKYLLELRQKRASRVMDRFFNKVKAATFLPKNALGKALTYAWNQKKALRGYVEGLRFRPDNNAVENVLRGWSLPGEYEYLKDVLSRINSHPHKKLSELLPQNWKPRQR